MGIAEYQAYGYFGLTAFLVFALYSYIYHLYSTDKKDGGHDYENYSNIALNDDISDAPVSPISDDKEK
ncbi:cytochrome c oxidase, cbb3-type, CcoQ subunit [bacterium]|nr:cytochrome c oxidase, cbb3-type, CcoQ subunit [bacterium]MBU1993201.1 cytochrome c oxidase, cbb3-type, CcoQ subunit [bacterium]